MEKKYPLISIVTVTYNCKGILQKTIDSVVGQDYPNMEYVIIDGASTDGTLDVIKRNAKYLSLVVSEPDSGIFDAMNKALSYITGDWVIFMNAGDQFWSSQTLTSCFNKSVTKDYGVVYGKTYCKKGDFQMTPFFKQHKKFQTMGISHQSLFVRADLAKSIRFDKRYRVAADYNMVREVYNRGFKFYYVDEYVSIYDLNGYSKANAWLQLKEVADICNAKYSFSYYVEIIKFNLKRIINRILFR